MEVRPIRYLEMMESPESQALLREYSAECSIPEIGKPSPQRAIYETMEASGLMHSFGVYRGDDLVGFATLLLFVLPHYGKKIANVESLFLSKRNRGGGAGLDLLDEIEKFASTEKCCGMLYNARTGSSLEQLLSVLPEYSRTNSVFFKGLA